MQEYQTSDYCFHHSLPVVPCPTLKQLTVLWSWPLCLYYIVKHSVRFMGNNKLGSSSGFWWFRLASQKPELLTLSSYLFTPFHPPFRSLLALQLTCQSSLELSIEENWNFSKSFLRYHLIYWAQVTFFRFLLSILYKAENSWPSKVFVKTRMWDSRPMHIGIKLEKVVFLKLPVVNIA